MKRIVTALVVIAALGAVAYFFYVPIDGWPVELRLVLVAIVTLAASIAAAITAFRSSRRTTALRADVTVLARSIDQALRDFARRNTKDVATIGEMNEHVARELEKIATHLLSRDEPAPGPTASSNGDNVVSLPAARRFKQMPGEMLAANMGERGAVEAAYRKALASGSLEISLQPIVSVLRSAAAGFEAFASLPVEGRGAIDIRRVAETLPGLGSATFERILVNGALQAGRRRLGAAGEEMPVHVAASEALLTERTELEAILDTLGLYPELAKAVVLSLPIQLFSKKGAEAEALTRLSGFGLRFAAEGWLESEDDASKLATAGVSFLKISANRLLDREKSRRRQGPAAAIVEAASAADIVVIATEVGTDEDAVSLIDLGLDLMIGERFSGPRRLKPEGDRPGGRFALS